MERPFRDVRARSGGDGEGDRRAEGGPHDREGEREGGDAGDEALGALVEAGEPLGRPRQRRREAVERGQQQRPDGLLHVPPRHAHPLRRRRVGLGCAAELGGQLLEDDPLRSGGVAEELHRSDLLLLLIRERHAHAGQARERGDRVVEGAADRHDVRLQLGAHRRAHVERRGEGVVEDASLGPHVAEGEEQGGQLATQLLGQKLLVEGLEAFARGQVGVFEEAGDLALEAVVCLGLEQIGEEALVTPVLGFGTVDGLVVLAGDGGQAHRAQEQGQRGGAHEATSATSWS